MTNEYPKGFEVGFRAFGLWSDARELLDITTKQAKDAVDIKRDLLEARAMITKAINTIEEYEHAN